MLNCAQHIPRAATKERRAMTPRRIKPYSEQVAEDAKRQQQLRLYQRNQMFGILLIAAAICAWWLFHTNPKWIITPGWWRP